MDDAGFERAVLQLKDRVHGYAVLILRDGAEAQDVAQEALVRMWRERARVEDEGAKTWLLRTAHNLCIDRLRRRRVRGEVADGEEVVTWRADDRPDPERQAAAARLGERIRSALGELSEIDRAVVVLREVEGLSYDEIAAMLGMPLGTLKARLHRARERLRERLVGAGVVP
jgi:RNA polymerase sigma-70 factor (ECF subfamily)